MAKVEKKARAPAKPRQKKNGYKFPEKLPAGEVLKDLKKAEWVLGPSIGKGGFGEIYSAKEASSKGNSYPCVVKIEPHENGPLFVENHFYLKVAKEEDVKAWKEKSGVKTLGIPAFYGLGSHEYNGQKYRFLVIERYGKDLWSTFLENGKKFTSDIVWQYAVQVINVLEYIHSKGYVHADIKGANLLLGLKKGTEKNIFLVDFGLSCKYTDKEFKRDPKKAHNGTIEYTSRDWHNGVPTRRGDMEILGFNLLHWINSSLPWENVLSDPVKVQEKKEKLMADVSSYFKQNLPDVPEVIVKYLDYVGSLRHNEAPNYNFCRSLFTKVKSTTANTPRKTPVRNGTSPRVSKANPKKVDTPKDSTPIRNGASPRVPKANPKKVDTTKDSTPVQKRARRQQKVIEPSDDEEEEEVEEETEDQTEEEEDIEESPDMFEVKKKVVRKRGRPEKNDGSPTPSWKDAPAIKASKVAKAGEYTKQTSPVKPARRGRSAKK